MGRTKIAVYRAGQVPPGQPWVPMTWDLNDSRVAQLNSYAPDEPSSAWANHKETIFDLVLRTEANGNPDIVRHSDTGLAYILDLLFGWAESKGYSTDPESLLMGDRMDEFIAAEFANKATRATYRTRLRKVSATIFPAPREDFYPRNPTLAPHTTQDRERFLAAAKSLIVGKSQNLKTR
jgi:hypothetical protein